MPLIFSPLLYSYSDSFKTLDSFDYVNAKEFNQKRRQITSYLEKSSILDIKYIPSDSMKTLDLVILKTNMIS